MNVGNTDIFNEIVNLLDIEEENEAEAQKIEDEEDQQVQDRWNAEKEERDLLQVQSLIQVEEEEE